MKLCDVVASIEKLEKSLEPVPWEVLRTGIKPTLFGSQISLTKVDDCDWIDLNEAKVVVTWLVDQLGGKVKWPK